MPLNRSALPGKIGYTRNSSVLEVDAARGVHISLVEKTQPKALVQDESSKYKCSPSVASQCGSQPMDLSVRSLIRMNKSGSRRAAGSIETHSTLSIRRCLKLEGRSVLHRRKHVCAR